MQNRAETKRLKELLQTEKESILVVIEKTINDGMRRIMTERFGPDRKSPYLQLRERSYSFEVEEDTGTGVAYTGLVLFDLTIFLLTRLPILVHDTVIFKNIENDSVSRLLPVYLETAKQSFIALDEIDKYGSETPCYSSSIELFSSTRRTFSTSRIGEAGLDDRITAGREATASTLSVGNDKRRSRKLDRIASEKPITED